LPGSEYGAGWGSSFEDGARPNQRPMILVHLVSFGLPLGGVVRGF
jgi:hypothetical protein